MRPKIAVLTVLTINAVVFGGYWLIKLIGLQAFWILHKFPGGHQCPKDDVPLSMIIFLMEVFGVAISIGACFLIKWLIEDVYKKIDKLFPEGGNK